MVELELIKMFQFHKHGKSMETDLFSPTISVLLLPVGYIQLYVAFFPPSAAMFNYENDACLDRGDDETYRINIPVGFPVGTTLLYYLYVRIVVAIGEVGGLSLTHYNQFDNP